MLSRLHVLTGNAESLAHNLINAPKIIGRRRASMLFNLAFNGDTKAERKLGRDALKACATAANRHRVIFRGEVLHSDRVFNKASNARLEKWAQNLNTTVWRFSGEGNTSPLNSSHYLSLTTVNIHPNFVQLTDDIAIREFTESESSAISVISIIGESVSFRFHNSQKDWIFEISDILKGELLAIMKYNNTDSRDLSIGKMYWKIKRNNDAKLLTV